MSSKARERLRSAWPKLGRTDWFSFVVLGLTMLGAWCFLEIADAVAEGGTARVDEFVVRSLRRADDSSSPVGPAWLGEVVRDLSALGGITILVLVIAAVVGYLRLRRAQGAILFVLAASLGGLFLGTLLKAWFRRPRPNLAPYLTHVATSSFPSGHTLNSAVVYLTLGALLARLSDRGRVKVFIIGWSILLTFLVGLSRVYLGAHYPTDILAGWTAGAAWMGFCLLIDRRFHLLPRSIETIASLNHPEN